MVDAIIDEALKYTQKGWKVFPLHSSRNGVCSCGNANCRSVAKHPRISDWQKNCTNKPSEIEDWWKKWPKANIGLATGGASGFFVLDVDPRHGGKESLQALVKKNGNFPKTLASHTGGGGYHIFFKNPEAVLKNKVNICPGLDIRGDGGYIVAPPSIHQSGKQYAWMHEFKDAEIFSAPTWLYDILSSKENGIPLSYNSSSEINIGSRNNYLFKLASKMRRDGFSLIDIEKNICLINQQNCKPPLQKDEIEIICKSAHRYLPAKTNHSESFENYWNKEPQDLDVGLSEVPSLDENYLPEIMKPWVMDIVERMQVSPEFVMSPALVGFSSVVGRKIGLSPRQFDDWVAIPNLWGAIVARPGFFKSPTIAEAMKPIEMLSEKARKQYEQDQFMIKSAQMIANMKLENLKDGIKKALKESDEEQVEFLERQAASIEESIHKNNISNKRYKTNDATVEKIAKLLNENPNGLLLLRDELNGWLQTLNKTGREGDREFFLEAWNGYSSYTVDRVGSGTTHVPAICLSVFGGIQPGKLQAYVEKTLRGGAEDDGLLQRFQILVYPELNQEWKDIDKAPDIEAREKVFELFSFIDATKINLEKGSLTVRFSLPAQELYRQWRENLENRIRSNNLSCSAFESHLSKYRSLMPSLALLFWLMEDLKNIRAEGTVSFNAVSLAIKWCDFLEKHAAKVYRIGHSANLLAVRSLSENIKNGMLTHKSSVRSIYRKHWRHLSSPQLVDQALESLEEMNWLKVVCARVQGGSSKRIMLHPRFQQLT